MEIKLNFQSKSILHYDSSKIYIQLFLSDAMLDKPQDQWYHNYIRFISALFSFIQSKSFKIITKFTILFPYCTQSIDHIEEQKFLHSLGTPMISTVLWENEF